MGHRTHVVAVDHPAGCFRVVGGHGAGGWCVGAAWESVNPTCRTRAAPSAALPGASPTRPRACRGAPRGGGVPRARGAAARGDPPTRRPRQRAWYPHPRTPAPPPRAASAGAGRPGRQGARERTAGGRVRSARGAGVSATGPGAPWAQPHSSRLCRHRCRAPPGGATWAAGGRGARETGPARGTRGCRRRSDAPVTWH